MPFLKQRVLTVGTLVLCASLNQPIQSGSVAHAQETAAPTTPTTPPTTPAAPSAASPTTPPGSSLPPQPAKPALQMDPKARELMDQMVAAYKALDSYSAIVELAGMGAANLPKQRAIIAFKKPNRVNVQVTTSTGTVKLVSNGTNLFVQVSDIKAEYVKTAAPSGEMAIAQLLQSVRASGPGLTPLVAGASPLEGMADDLKSVSVGPADTVDGVAVETVVGQLEAGPSKGTITFAIGRDDHLLRRVVLTSITGQRTVTLTETHTSVKANPAGMAFIFTPPPGAKAVAQFTPPPRYDTRLKVGAKPLAFQAKDLAGKPLSLDQYAGKVVLLDFWASWCGPCIGEMPNVVAAYNKYKAQGFDIIGISLDAERDQMTAFAKEFKMPWRQNFDGRRYDNAVAKLYGVSAIPFSVLIGRDGKIAALDLRGPDLGTAINAALAKKPTAAGKTAKKPRRVTKVRQTRARR